MTQDRNRSSAENPVWMVLGLIGSGWSAASTSHAWWVRLGSLVLCAAWATLLLRHVINRRRRRRPPLPDVHG